MKQITDQICSFSFPNGKERMSTRQLLTCGILLLVAAAHAGDLTVDNLTALTNVTVNGTLGVGTNASFAKVGIKGDLFDQGRIAVNFQPNFALSVKNITDAGGSVAEFLSDTNLNAPRTMIRFGKSSSFSQASSFMYFGIRYDVSPLRYEYYNNGAGISAPIMTILNNSGGSSKGQVGINTVGGDTPAAQLQVISYDSSSIAGIFQGAASQTADIFQIRNSASNVLGAFTASGSFGIGTNLPAERLHVIGNIRVNPVWSADTSFLRIASSSTNDGISIYGNDTVSGVGNWYIGNDAWDPADKKFRITAFSSKPMVFSVGNIERLRIASNGKVGIGTNSPSEALHVAGNIKIDGQFIGNATGLYVPQQGDLSMGTFTQ